jgi:hypothetical protein
MASSLLLTALEGPKDDEQKQARAPKSTPIGEDEDEGKPYVELDINGYSKLPRAQLGEGRTTAGEAQAKAPDRTTRLISWLPKSTPIGEDEDEGKPYVELDINVRFKRRK